MRFIQALVVAKCGIFHIYKITPHFTLNAKMKDFNGNYANVNPKLDTDNAYMIYNNTVSSTEETRYYTPKKDGVVIISCSFRQGAKVYLEVTTESGEIKRLGSIVQSANSAGADNQVMTVPVSTNRQIKLVGKNYSAEYIPYL